MRIAMRADLVAGLRDLAHLLGKRFDRMARDEPGSFDLVAVVQPEQPWGAHLAGEKAARNIERRILTAIGAEPARDRVNIDAEAAENLFVRGGAHGHLPYATDCARTPSASRRGCPRLRRPGDVSFPFIKEQQMLPLATVNSTQDFVKSPSRFCAAKWLLCNIVCTS